MRPTIRTGLAITVGGRHEPTTVPACADQPLYFATRDGGNRVETSALDDVPQTVPSG
jgi:hypothetical protein